MSIAIGIDIGSISIKAAVAAAPELRGQLKAIGQRGGLLADLGKEELQSSSAADSALLVSCYRRIRGNPLEAAKELFCSIMNELPGFELSAVRVTGSGSKLLAAALGAEQENEFKAIARAVGAIYPQVNTVFEMGGETSKFIRIERDPASGTAGILDYETNGDCAAGTGSFLDQQALRLKFSVEEIGDVVAGAKREAQIAGRCSVFAKSDMVHAQQKGYRPEEVLKGLCAAVARNFKGSITKGKKVVPVIAFIGGVAANRAVVAAMEEVFRAKPGELFVPRYHSWLGAIGCALGALEASAQAKRWAGFDKKGISEKMEFPESPPLNLEKVLLLRDRVKPYGFDKNGHIIDAYLGVDIGSVSTNLALIDSNGDLIKEIYLRTNARPIQVVDAGLKEIKEELGSRVRICGVGATGSGRELIGELIGADTINDEITAHKTGANYIGEKLIDKKADTIFEIGGQDSKFISLQDGVVVDFAMNEACAAGTGSFLEERAEELHVRIEGEFARLAFRSKSPIKLGERCTVFMERDVNSYMQRGARKEDIIAGLAYSIALNYINRVVRGRRIGETIFFQGGTAYNDAVAAAFSSVLDKPIIVPPHNGVMGAIGAALLARDKMEANPSPSRFRGYSLEEVNYTLKEFTCRACSNFCAMQEFDVQGEKTYWGDKCSDKFRKRAKTDNLPVIEDLLEARKRLLFADYREGCGGKLKVGLPRCMYTYELFPFWNRLLLELGLEVVLSEETSQKIINGGIDATVAEPCFPVKVAHGHVLNLLEKGADIIVVPNLINRETNFKRVESYLCSWGQTLPFMISRAKMLRDARDKLLSPTLRFRDGIEAVGEVLGAEFARYGLPRKKTKAAVAAGWKAQSDFYSELQSMGRDAFLKLKACGAKGIVLIGRPYNVNDDGINVDIGAKLRNYYGVNIIPMDFLPLDDVDISDVNDNMFWNYGRKILAAAKIVGRQENLHIIYITNFKCGPDSYIKHFIKKASGKPFLSLQFDGHANDAGFITRCEAYLDSKGFLRCWSDAGKISGKALAQTASR